MINNRVIILFVTISLWIPVVKAGAEPLPNTLKYKLDLRVDYRNEKLYGNCEITVSNGKNLPINRVPILLYRLLSVKSVIDENGLPMKFEQKVVNITGWEKLQVNFIEILLDRNLSPGEQRTIRLSYEGYLLGYAREGWRYVKDQIDKDFTIIRTDGFDYPVLGYPNDQDMMIISQECYDYLLKITVPDDIKAVCGGELVDLVSNKGETTYTFKSKKPSWRFDIALSDYRILGQGRDRICYFKSDSVGAKTMMLALEKSLNLYSGWFGTIENYQGYSIIEVPEGYSSQQDVTSFCITADNFKNPQDMSAIYHEISHLWNVKDPEPQSSRFESEGLAQFLEFLLSEKLDKKENAVALAAQRYLEVTRKEFLENPEYQKIPIKDYGSHNMTNYSYTLGMVAFALLYELTGPVEFNKAIHFYYSTYQTSGATLDEFINCFKRASAPQIERFFNDWIYSANAIDLVIKGKSYKDMVSYYSVK